MNRFLNGVGCHMFCEPLNEFRKTRIHLRVRDGCHVSILFGSGRDNATVSIDTQLTDLTAVITISRSTWRTTKNKYGIATDLFCTGVIGHPGHLFLN